MKAEQIIIGRFKALLQEVLTYHSKIEEIVVDKKQLIAKLTASKDQPYSEELRELAKQFVEVAEMEVIVHNDYNQMLSIAKEIATQAKVISPDINEKLTDTEKELLTFLEDWNSLLCKAVNGKIEIAHEALKQNLEKRKNDLTEEHVQSIIKNVSNINI